MDAFLNYMRFRPRQREEWGLADGLYSRGIVLRDKPRIKVGYTVNDSGEGSYYFLAFSTEGGLICEKIRLKRVPVAGLNPSRRESMLKQFIQFRLSTHRKVDFAVKGMHRLLRDNVDPVLVDSFFKMR